MATTAKLVYEICNGPFKGKRQSIAIAVPSEKLSVSPEAVGGVIGVNVSVLGNLIGTGLYIKAAKGAAPAFREVAARLTRNEIRIQSLTEGEIEADFTADAVVVSTEAAVTEGALSAAAGASLAPGVGWVVAACLLTATAVIDAGLAIYSLTRPEKKLVSIIIVNAVPNSKMTFTGENASDGNLIGGDTHDSILTDIASTDMEVAGAVAYTYETLNAMHGDLEIDIDFGSGGQPGTGGHTNARLNWSADFAEPSAGPNNICKMTNIQGADSIEAYCKKFAPARESTNHRIILYVLFPSVNGAKRVRRLYSESDLGALLFNASLRNAETRTVRVLVGQFPRILTKEARLLDEQRWNRIVRDFRQSLAAKVYSGNQYSFGTGVEGSAGTLSGDFASEQKFNEARNVFLNVFDSWINNNDNIPGDLYLLVTPSIYDVTITSAEHGGIRFRYKMPGTT